MPIGVYPRPLVLDRFWAKVDQRGPDECWPWGGHKQWSGYGSFSVSHNASIGAHRFMWELVHALPIPKGLHIDHLCSNPPCVNPAHLEVVTPQENTRRGRSRPGVNSRKTHCKNGHPLDRANTYVTKRGFRNCRTCNRAIWRAWDARRKAAAKAPRRIAA